VVTLLAAANDGSSFTGWSGCDSVSGTTCTVTIGGAKSVTATFRGTFAQIESLRTTVAIRGTLVYRPVPERLTT
jgi:hypothetical protein